MNMHTMNKENLNGNLKLIFGFILQRSIAELDYKCVVLQTVF